MRQMLLCGAPIDGRSGTLEHIDAALGNSESNLTVACPPCNSGKHARPKGIWLKRLATRGIRHDDLPDSILVQRRMLYELIPPPFRPAEYQPDSTQIESNPTARNFAAPLTALSPSKPLSNVTPIRARARLCASA